MTLYTVKTTHKSDTVPVKVVVDPVYVDDIPAAMDKMKWNTAAKLMRHWFSIKPAFVMTDDIRSGSIDPLKLKSNQYNDDIVKIDWLLSHRTWQAADVLVHHTWRSEKGISRLRDLLAKAGWHKGKSTPTYLGSSAFTAKECDAYCQVNLRTAGTKFDLIDGLFGAIGNGTLKIAVIGKAFNDKGRDLFHVEKTGVYLRDTYDFTGDDELLGVWSKDKVLGKLETVAYMTDPIESDFEGYVAVYNRDFRRWQKVHNSGGDFVVYSDVKWRAQKDLYVEL